MKTIKAEISLREIDPKVHRALQCLIDNGIDADEAETVLQAIGYILMDRELFPG